MNLPIDTTLIPKSSLDQNAKQYFQELFTKLKVSQEIAAQNLQAVREKAEHRHDVKAKVPTYNLNDLVLLKHTVVQEGLGIGHLVIGGGGGFWTYMMEMIPFYLIFPNVIG